MRYYGWYGLIHSVGTVIVYILINNNYYVAFASKWWLSQIWFFAPVGFGWLMLSFFDGELMREIFGKVVGLSLMGPFFNHWVALIDFILAGENAGKDWNWGDSSITAYDELWFYLSLTLYFAYTVFQALI